jgi:hypothetical protein
MSDGTLGMWATCGDCSRMSSNLIVGMMWAGMPWSLRSRRLLRVAMSPVAGHEAGRIGSWNAAMVACVPRVARSRIERNQGQGIKS